MSPHLSELSSRAVIALDGAEGPAFLQGLVSNDTERLGPDHAIYAAMLSPQGKFLHEMILARRDGTILIDTEAARAPDLLRRLTLYKLRAKITLAPRPDLCVLALWGESAGGGLGLPAAAGAARALDDGIALVDPRAAGLGLRLILPRDGLEGRLRSLGLALDAEEADWDRHRLEIGVPDGSRDIQVDKSLLLEANFDTLNGVSFDKGCYVGQELTARTKYRATLKRRLYPVTFDGPAPAADTPVLLGEKEAGIMRTARDGVGLALLRIEDVAAAQAGGGTLTAAGTALHTRAAP